MRLLAAAFTFGFFSCGNSLQNVQSADGNTPPIATKKTGTPAIGETIRGDFNGDGQQEYATAMKIVWGKGNLVENGTPDEYEIQFSNGFSAPIKVGCCALQLINEGDLNNDGADEISMFQAPMNGCTYLMSTYCFTNKKWKQIIKPFLIPTGCETISYKEMEARIFYENKSIYYYETDPNDEGGKLIKKQAVVR